jgi:hypothetical protein
VRTDAPNASDRRVRRGAGPALPNWIKIIIFFQLLEKHFHPCPSIRCLPIAVFNETGQLRAPRDGFILALILQ